MGGAFGNALEAEGEAHAGGGGAESELDVGEGRKAGGVGGAGHLAEVAVAHAQEDDARRAGGEAGEHGDTAHMDHWTEVRPHLVHGLLTADGDENGSDDPCKEVYAAEAEADRRERVAAGGEADAPAPQAAGLLPGGGHIGSADLGKERQGGLLVQFFVQDGELGAAALQFALMPLGDILGEGRGSPEEGEKQDDDSFHGYASLSSFNALL